MANDQFEGRGTSSTSRPSSPSTKPSAWANSATFADNFRVPIPAILRPSSGAATQTLAGANTPNNINPYGGVRTTSSGGGGGGGGAPVTPGLDQGSFDAMIRLIGKKPQSFNYTPLDLPDYNAPDFYDFDGTQYDLARQGLTEGIAAGRQSGNQTYDDARFELDQYQNPYGNVQTTNPGVRDAMARMMQANGIDPNILSGVDAEGVQADRAFGNTQALLAGTADQRQASNQRALSGDQRRFNENLSGEERSMGLSIDMALARARSQYDKDLWQYGKDEADRRYEIAVAEATANNQGVNSANQANTQAMNTWQQGAVNPLMELLLSGRNSAGVQGLNLAALADMFK